MDKWIYLTETLTTLPKGSLEFKLMDIDRQLTARGSEGWELVNVIQLVSGSILAIFKQKIKTKNNV